MNSKKTLPLMFSIAFTAFTVCSLQFYELNKISHETTMKAYEDGTLAADNLSLVLKPLELVEQKYILNNTEQPISQSAEWATANEKLVQFSNRLKLKNKFHNEITAKISKIQLRNSFIGLVLILGSLISAFFLKKNKVTGRN